MKKIDFVQIHYCIYSSHSFHFDTGWRVYDDEEYGCPAWINLETNEVQYTDPFLTEEEWVWEGGGGDGGDGWADGGEEAAEVEHDYEQMLMAQFEGSDGGTKNSEDDYESLLMAQLQ